MNEVLRKINMGGGMSKKYLWDRSSHCQCGSERVTGYNIFFSFFIKNNSLLLVKSTAGYSSDRDSLLNEMGACLWSKMSSGRDSLLDETAHHGKDSLP